MKWLSFMGCALVLSVPRNGAADTKIYVEAERPSSMIAPLTVVQARPGLATNTGYLEIPWDYNKSNNVAQAVYKFTVDRPGIYIVWARTFWLPDCGNSIKIAINDGPDNILGEDGTYGTWHWVGGKARVQLKRGLNTLVLKRRETGIRVDRFGFYPEEKSAPIPHRKIAR